MISKVWKREFTDVSIKIETISFDKEGKQILPYEKGNSKTQWANNRPLIVFHYGEYTFYLNVRSSGRFRKKLPFEYELSNPERKQNDWVDTSNILIMETEEFNLLYKNLEYEEINDLKFEDAKNIINMIINNFTEHNLPFDKTIQKVEINKLTMQPESKIVYSTLPIPLEKQLLDEEAYHCRDALWYIINDFKNASDSEIKEYIAHRKNDWDLINSRYEKELQEDKDFEMIM